MVSIVELPAARCELKPRPYFLGGGGGGGGGLGGGGTGFGIGGQLSFVPLCSSLMRSAVRLA